MTKYIYDDEVEEIAVTARMILRFIGLLTVEQKLTSIFLTPLQCIDGE